MHCLPIIAPVPVVVSLALTPATSTLQIGATRQLAAIATYSDGTTVDVTATNTFVSTNPAIGTYSDSTTAIMTSSVTWSSGNNAIATVKNGVATGLAAGTTTVVATLGAQSGHYRARRHTCDVTFAGNTDLAGQTLAPGVYSYAGANSAFIGSMLS
jgi:uncharacterized protein YjdB